MPRIGAAPGPLAVDRARPAAAASAGPAPPAPVDVLERAGGRATFVAPTAPAALEARAPAKVGGVVEVKVQVPHPGKHKDDVVVKAVIVSPSGKRTTIGGFAHDGAHAIRFLPTEPGRWKYTLMVDGAIAKKGAVAVEPAPWKGFVRSDGYALRHEDGTRFFPLGENRINIYDRKWNHDGMTIESYVAAMKSHGMNTLRVFIFDDAKAEDRPKKDQLGCLEPKVGRFDEKVAKRFDRILKSAEKHGLKVVLCAHAIGFSDGDGETWKAWRDNPYNEANGGPASDRYMFFWDEDAKAAQKKKFDYILARWGASPALFGVDLLNEPEWDGALPEEDWIPWAKEMARYVKSKDPFDRPVQVGSVGLHWNIGSDERPWWDAKECGVVQWHLYGEAFYDPHALAAEMERKIEETWNHGKPTLVGEFAYGGEDKVTYDHTHAGIWSATFSGAGALAHSAPPFNIDCDEFMTPARGAHFKVLSDFLATLDPKATFLPRKDLVLVKGNAGAKAFCLADGAARALWIMAGKQGYGQPVKGASVVVKELPAGTYQATFVDDTTGKTLATKRFDAAGDATLALPEFVRHVAVRIDPV